MLGTMNLKNLSLIALTTYSLTSTQDTDVTIHVGEASSSQRIIPIPDNRDLSYLNGQLASAALKEDIPTMKRLIAAGADVNSQQFIYDPGFHPMNGQEEIKNITILIYLLMKDTVNLDVLKVLMDAGANPNLTDSNGRNAFTLTAGNTNKELHDILHKKTPKTF